MGLSFLTPLFLAGLLAVAVPILVHLIRRHRGEPLPFPSLMFVRRLPVRSVRRRRIRDWPLLLVRVLALALIVFAFARPVLRVGAAEGEGAAGGAFREVVVVLDRSWSMTFGDRWERARAAVEEVLDGLVPPDRVSLVLFDRTGRVEVEPTLEPARVRTALQGLRPGWGATRIGAGLQSAAGVLEASDRSRREVVLVSDFQRRGWEDGPRETLPAAASLVPVDVGTETAGLVAVTEVTLQHTFLGGRQQVRPVARVARLGEDAAERVRVTLELEGREVEGREADLAEEGAASISFDPFVLPEGGVRGAVTVAPADGAGARGVVTGPDVSPAAAGDFRFVVSPREILSVLVLRDPGAADEGAPYLERALALGGGAPVRVETRSPGGFSEEDVRSANVIFLDDVPLPSGAPGGLLRSHVEEGGGLVVVAGPGSRPVTWEEEWEPLLPGRPGQPVDRDPARGGRLTQVERDHPVFLPFAAEGGRGLGAPGFYRYRSLSLADGEAGDDEAGAAGGPRVLARFDDGTPALAERPTGRGRVLLWTSSMDALWTDLPLQGVFLPLVQEMARYAAGAREATPYFTVGQPLESAFILERAGFREDEDAERGVLVGPDGRGVEMGEAGLPPQIGAPGFYEVRADDPEGRVTWTFAVNPDPAEADPSRVDAEELALAATGDGGTASGGEPGAPPVDEEASLGSLAERERRQGGWRYLLLGALLLLAGETLLANRRGRPFARDGSQEAS